MCFTPQRCDFFPQLNFQKWSEHELFDTFYSKMCFAPQQRALFSTAQLPKVLRDRHVLTLVTSKCALLHNGVQIFIYQYQYQIICPAQMSPHCFSEPPFRPSGAAKHWKNTVFRDLTSPPFRTPASSLFWLSPSLIFSMSSQSSQSSLV